jgi:hypothetical protein
MVIAVICFTVIMSSSTSYVFYFRGFSEETIAKERRLERYESLRGYLVDVRNQSAGVLGTLREAGAELDERIRMESSTGGGLRNISNPYLQQLIAESDLIVDLRQVEIGSGERYRFLTSLAPRLDQMESDVATALAGIDAEIAVLTEGSEVDHEAMRSSYSRASALVPVDRIREVRGDFVASAVDPATLDTSAMEEEYWQRAVTELFAGSPTAIVFAFIAVFIDTMIVFFTFVAGQGQASTSAPRVPLAHWVRMSYKQRFEEGIRCWIGALDGVRVQRSREVLHRLEVRRLNDDRAAQCARLLRQDGYLKQVMLEATNPGGHSSVPRADNVICALVAALGRIQAHEFPLELNDGTRAFFERSAEFQHGEAGEWMRQVAELPFEPQIAAQLAGDNEYFNATLRTTCVATQLEGGHAENALPRSA